MYVHDVTYKHLHVRTYVLRIMELFLVAMYNSMLLAYYDKGKQTILLAGFAMVVL